MRRYRRFLLVLGVVALVGTATPAQAAQLDPRTEPEISGGSLSDPARSCSRHVTKRGGRKAAVLRSCTFLYVQGMSLDRTHAVVWKQVWAQTRNGFCLKRIDSDLTRGLEMNSFDQVVPNGSLSTAKPKRVEASLTVDAGGTMTEPATVRQPYVLRPNRVRGTLRMTEAGERFRTAWRGSTRRAVAVVSGIDFSWNTALGTPSVGSISGYGIKKQASC